MYNNVLIQQVPDRGASMIPTGARGYLSHLLTLDPTGTPDSILHGFVVLTLHTPSPLGYHRVPTVHANFKICFPGPGDVLRFPLEAVKP